MFGYVVTDKGELKVKEYEAYKAVYCGLCKELGRSFGFPARLNLSYDLTFLALLGMALGGDDRETLGGRCLLNPFLKRRFSSGKAVKYSAFTSIFLTYAKLCDDIADEKFHKRLAARALKLIFAPMRKKAARALPEIDASVSFWMKTLREKETADKKFTLDEYADSFAKLLEGIFMKLSDDESAKKILAQIGYHTGRWIYILDACDDFERDIKLGRFNPLLEPGDNKIYKIPLETKAKKGLNINAINETLTDSLARIAAAFELLELTGFKGILENIIYLGMPSKQSEIIFGKGRTGK